LIAPRIALAAIAIGLTALSFAATRGDEQARLQNLRERIERLRSALAESEGDVEVDWG